MFRRVWYSLATHTVTFVMKTVFCFADSWVELHFKALFEPLALNLIAYHHSENSSTTFSLLLVSCRCANSHMNCDGEKEMPISVHVRWVHCRSITFFFLSWNCLFLSHRTNRCLPWFRRPEKSRTEKWSTGIMLAELCCHLHVNRFHTGGDVS